MLLSAPMKVKDMATKSTKSKGGKSTKRTTAKRKPVKRNLDPQHKAQGYGQASTWPTSRGRRKYVYIKAHYRSS